MGTPESPRNHGNSLDADRLVQGTFGAERAVGRFFRHSILEIDGDRMDQRKNHRDSNRLIRINMFVYISLEIDWKYLHPSIV